ncbi:MAG: hypothetical protein ACRCYC_11940 [Paraclostridium sp.]|uniref:hypothetical protein n=1 Tax=Paraclostridium sp. TaxID=2023273 RepID=UPI003F3473CD
MTSNIFDISDVISIVMAMLEDIENEEIYGIQNEDLNIPLNINDKIEDLSNDECEEFFSLIEVITNKVYGLKNGELHELNIIHKEIINFSNENLQKYIIE